MTVLGGVAMVVVEKLLGFFLKRLLIEHFTSPGFTAG
jgi:hypothetical protein